MGRPLTPQVQRFRPWLPAATIAVQARTAPVMPAVQQQKSPLIRRKAGGLCAD